MPDTVSILVVEDLEVVRTMLASLLEARGFQVDVAADGPAAVERAASSPYALFVLDIVLPGGFDGLETCKAIRSMPSHVRTPIVMVSGRSDIDLQTRALAVGADRFFLKPYSAVAMLQAIETLVRR